MSTVSDRVGRRGALRRLGSIVAGGAVALAAGPRSSRAASRPPNIIFILTDDLAYGDLGCYGQTRILTPNLDALARDGMRFTNYYAGAPECAPSRCSLLTGLHTGHTSIRDNRLRVLPETDVTVAELLRAQGYVTGAIGKWQLGGVGTTGEPWRQGFDYFFGNLVADSDYYPPLLYRNTRPITIEGNLNGAEQVYYPDLCTTDALAFIRQHAGERFFLYLSYIIPHGDDAAYHATGKAYPVPTYDPYADEAWPEAEKGYAAMVTRLDGYVGRIAQLLRAQGIAENTVIFFTSDNGASNEYGHDPAFFNCTGGLRGGKYGMYEGGLRVPMVAYWPGTIRAGATSAQQWANWDFLPTALDLAGAPPASATDGVSVASALCGAEPVPRDYLYWENPYWTDGGQYTVGPAQAVRTGRWKGLRWGFDQALELYDLATDIGETQNVAASHPGVVARIEAVMGSARTGIPVRVNTRAPSVATCVRPDWGTPGVTTFHWECRVQDLDGDPPQYVRLTIYRDGAGWQIVDMNPTDSVAYRGRLYVYARKLPAGNYHYQIEAADKDGVGRFPLDAPALGPILPAPPYLTWTGEPGFAADGVEPDTGEPNTTLFEFRVLYRAHDGDPPEEVELALWRNGRGYHTFPMKPSLQTSDPVEGLVYYLRRVLPEGQYEYRVSAADQHGKAQGPASVRMSGPAVEGGASVISGLAATPTRAGGAQITFSLSAPAEVTVDVTNIAGRPVATVARGTKLPRGVQAVVWNGRGAQGLPAPNGAYVVRVDARCSDGATSHAVTTCAIRR
jgi:arylsulfatase A-like enzyme